MLRWLIVAAGLAAAMPAFAEWPTGRIGDRAVWDQAFDVSTGTRFIPLQLILPRPWDGARVFEMLPTDFRDLSGDIWSGPVEDKDILSGSSFPAYVRERSNRREGHVVQRFAIRKEGDGLGRTYDSRFGGITCIGEIKFPVGTWTQGEVRRNEFVCAGPSGRTSRRVNTITVEKIDFPCNGVEHCLQIRWLHEAEGRPEALDNRRYVFAPGQGEIVHDRLP